MTEQMYATTTRIDAEGIAMKVTATGPKFDTMHEQRKYAVGLLLDSIGEDVTREGLVDTPKRVAKMYDELFAGYSQDPAEILSRTFAKEECDDMVVVKDIDFYSHCEHHMVPFFGKAHIAYIPGEQVVGISKLARLVECYARRLQIQERMTTQIADDIMKYLGARGAMVVINAEHLCMGMRGVKKPGANTTTSAARGVFADNENNARAEFLSLINNK